MVIPPPSKPYSSGAASQPMMPSRNPYQQTMGSGSYRPFSAPGTGPQSQQQQHARNRSYNPKDRIPTSSQSYTVGGGDGGGGVGSSGGSVTSRRTTSSGGGGRIRNITATSDYSFSGGGTAAGSVTSRRTTSRGGRGGIRNITATSNYSFSGGGTAAANANANAGGPGRKRALSPSNAYAANKSSSGSWYNGQQVPRSPSNYHQQSRHQGQGYRR